MAASSSKSGNGQTPKQCKLCTFCNNSTNGYEKRLFTEPQPKGPFFPILTEIEGASIDLDELGRAVVCIACFHHLLRQWSSFERRGIPLQKRVYNLVTGTVIDSLLNVFNYFSCLTILRDSVALVPVRCRSSQDWFS